MRKVIISLFIALTFGNMSWSQTGFPATYQLMGLLPEYRLNEGGRFTGLSYSYMMATVGIGAVGFGISGGMDWNTRNNMYAFKAGIWTGLSFFIVGANTKLSYVRHFTKSRQQISSIRPEAGLAIGPFFFNYGLDIFLKKNQTELGPHNFMITTYIPLFIISEDYYGVPAWDPRTPLDPTE